MLLLTPPFDRMAHDPGYIKAMCPVGGVPLPFFLGSIEHVEQLTPGTQRQYSGEGFHYLQSVVHVNVLEPFGMASNRFVWDDEAYARQVARGHDKDGTPIVEPTQTAAQKAEGLATYGAAAMLQTTPGDYAKFLLEVVDPKPEDAFRLNERSWRDYLRPQFKRDEITSSGLGWVVGQLGALTFFTHAGSAPGWQWLASPYSASDASTPFQPEKEIRRTAWPRRRTAGFAVYRCAKSGRLRCRSRNPWETACARVCVALLIAPSNRSQI